MSENNTSEKEEPSGILDGWVSNIPNTFARVQNKTLSLHNIRTGIMYGAIKPEEVPPEIMEKVQLYMKQRYGQLPE